MSEASQPVSLTESAAKRINQLIEMEGNPDMKLRLSITGGGCSGFSYSFALDDQVNDDDNVYENFGVKFLVDETSLEFVSGSQIDFVTDLMGSSFKVTNPQATSSCGCGSSFSV